MSGELSFLARFAQQDGARAENPARSAFRRKLRLSAPGPITRPVDVARALTRAGIRLAIAHELLGRITEQLPTVAEVDGQHVEDLTNDLDELGVIASLTEAPIRR